MLQVYQIVLFEHSTTLSINIPAHLPRRPRVQGQITEGGTCNGRFARSRKAAAYKILQIVLTSLYLGINVLHIFVPISSHPIPSRLIHGLGEVASPQ